MSKSADRTTLKGGDTVLHARTTLVLCHRDGAMFAQLDKGRSLVVGRSAPSDVEIPDPGLVSVELGGAGGLTERQNTFAKREAVMAWAAAHGQGAPAEAVERDAAEFLARTDVHRAPGLAERRFTTSDLLAHAEAAARRRNFDFLTPNPGARPSRKSWRARRRVVAKARAGSIAPWSTRRSRARRSRRRPSKHVSSVE